MVRKCKKGSLKIGEMNKNVLLNLVLGWASGLANSIWNGTILMAYLFNICGQSNTKVGTITAVQGAAQLLTAFPAGWAADRFSRSKVIAFGGCCLLLSTGCLAYAIVDGPQLNSSASFYLHAAALGMFGLAGGIISGPAQALLADSLNSGTRAKFYNMLMVLSLLASTVGPLLCIILFSFWNGYLDHSDAWPIGKLKLVLLIGLGLEIPVAMLMFMFDDKKALGAASEAVGGSEKQKEQLDVYVEEGVYQEVLEDEEDEEDETDFTALESRTSCCGLLNYRSIPYIVFTCDLVIALASGMTVNFFPLFFKEDCNMSPAEVQTIYFIVPNFMALCSTVGTKLAKAIGRVQAVGLLRFFGLSFFVGIVVLSRMKANPWVIVVFYIIRTALMNGTYPLEESILMDFVPKKERARWKSLESVGAFGWCGSAMLGGYLSDKHGYTFTFITTILLQALATVMYITMLLPLVPKSEGDCGGAGGEGGSGDESLSADLLTKKQKDQNNNVGGVDCEAP